MKKYQFTYTEFQPSGALLYYPWGPGGESFYINPEDAQALNNRFNILALVALGIFLIVTILNVVLIRLPIQAIGFPTLAGAFLIGIIYNFLYCRQLRPDLNPIKKESARKTRRGQILGVLFFGLVTSCKTYNDQRDFAWYPAHNLSILTLIITVVLIIIFWATKGHPIQTFARLMQR